MSKAEKFIEDCTRNCINTIRCYDKDCNPHVTYALWLTTNQARKAVKIARAEMIEKVCSYIADNIGEYIELKNAIPTTFFEIDVDRFTNDLKQAMKDET